MLYKNDNLEELFQKAANDYPLRTDSSNWNNVAAKLNIPAAEDVTPKKSSAWKYAAIIILLLGCAILLYTTQFNSDKTQQKVQADKTTASGKNNSNKKQDQSVAPAGSSSQKSNVIANKNAATVSEQKKNESLKMLSSSVSGSASKKSSDNYSMLNKTNDNNLLNNDLIKGNEQPSLPLNNTRNNSSASAITKQDIQSSTPFINDNNKIDNNNKADATSQNVNTVATNNSSKAKKSTIKYKAPPTKFYGSLYGGIELSNIKSQKIQNAGYKIGIALAYRMNSRFDIEIGLQREHLNYYTDGKYFDKSGLKLKDFAALESVNAKSNLTTVPITVKYNFKSKGNGHFYTGAGFNAVVLTHTENYNYVVTKNGDEDDRAKNYKSVTAPKYFTSLNTVAGYQNKLMNWCDFKIEPYYQIPIKKLGVGNLPVTSFGVNIGIVKNLK